MRGFEPPTPGTTIQCSNQLSYIHRVEESKFSPAPEMVNGPPARSDLVAPQPASGGGGGQA